MFLVKIPLKQGQLSKHLRINEYHRKRLRNFLKKNRGSPKKILILYEQETYFQTNLQKRGDYARI